eukprot:4020461-Alexandrium_andersonii.AAC.1
MAGAGEPWFGRLSACQRRRALRVAALRRLRAGAAAAPPSSAAGELAAAAHAHQAALLRLATRAIDAY